MTVPEALQDPRLKRFDLRRHRLHCAGGELSVVAPARPDALLEGDAGARCLRERQMPYWAEIWPASVGMARHLMKGPDLTGKRVMDLGCGIGIAGLAAGQRGAHVHFVDRSEEALHFARFNARRIPAERLSFEALDWFEATAEGSFDCILLADVAYEERNFEPLRRHLSKGLVADGFGILGDPERKVVDHFLAWLQPDFGGVTQRLQTSFDGQKYPVRLVHLTRT